MMSLQYKFGEFPLLLNLTSDSLPTSSLSFFFLTPASWPLLILRHGTVTSGPLHCCVCCVFFFFFGLDHSSFRSLLAWLVLNLKVSTIWSA